MATPSAYAHYKCNDDAANTTVADTGSGSNNGTASTNTSNLSVTGVINDALQLTAASTEYINIDALEVDIASDTSGSLAFWVNADSDIAGTLVAFADTDANSYLLIQRENTQDKFYIQFYTGGANKWVWESSTTVAPISTNLHFVVSHNATEPTFYLNGIAHAGTFTDSTDKTAWISDIAGVDNGRIGCLNTNSGGNTAYFDGRIDDFRYYQNAALTIQDVKNIYRGGTGTEDDPPAFFAIGGTQAIIIT